MDKTIEEYVKKWINDLENMAQEEDPGYEEFQLTQFERSLLKDLKKLFPNLTSNRKRISGTRLLQRALVKAEAELRQAGWSKRHYGVGSDDYLGSYVVITDIETWGSGLELVPDEEIDAANERAEEWCDENSPPGVEIQWRKAHPGEVVGTYIWDNGDLQILGYSLSIPDVVQDLTQQAWEYAIKTWA